MDENLLINNLFSVKNKVVVITGGSSGIGLMMANGFVANGAKVYITSRKKDVCDKVAYNLTQKGKLSNSGGSCISIPADLSLEKECLRLVEELNSYENHVDVLINNAGCNWGEAYQTFPEKAFQKVMTLNVKSVFLLTRAMTPLLQRGGSKDNPARVINIGSIDGVRIPILETYAYSASKAALHHMTKVLASKLAPKNITVNVILPGPFETRMTKGTFSKFKKQIEDSVPLKRMGNTPDMVGVALFLSSMAGAWITGASIVVDGGVLILPSKF